MGNEKNSLPLISRFVKFLGHPAWNGISCFFTALGTFGFGAIIVAYAIGFFKRIRDVIDWLTTSIYAPRWVISLGGLIIISIAASSIYRYVRNRKTGIDDTHLDPRKNLQKDYHEFWGVLWKPSYNWWDGMSARGPYCPEHLLRMDVAFSDNEFTFSCSSDPEDRPHIVKGPSLKDLLLPKDANRYDPDVLLEHDVSERLSAEWRREGRL